jgi:hypothetical protein
MPVNRAVKAHREERHNCAQSVLRGFQEHANVSEEAIAEAKALGGGRAPNGQCGALHAAIVLLADDGAKAKLTEAFVAHAGAETCRDVRKLGKLTCTECVKVASELLLQLQSPESQQ